MAISRFLAKVQLSTHSDGCHIWTGSLNERGYGNFWDGTGRVVKAHAWIDNLLHGPLPPGIERDHTCNTRRCVNPAHIERVTHTENMRRARERNPGHWGSDHSRAMARARWSGTPFAPARTGPL